MYMRRHLIGAFLLLFIFAFLPVQHVSAAITCRWEGARYCVFGATPATLQLTTVTTQCTDRCGYSGSAPQRSGVLFNNLGPTASQDGTGQCVPFSPAQDDILANQGQLIRNLENSGCLNQGAGERLVLTEGTWRILQSDGTVKSLSAECLFDMDAYNPTYRVSVDTGTSGSSCSSSFDIVYDETPAVIVDPFPTTTNPDGPSPGTQLTTTPEPQLPDDKPIGAVYEMCGADDGIETAIGCVSINPQGFITSLVNIGIGLGGGIAFLLILLGGFRVMISRGNPEQMEAGKELISSAVAGLFLIIFSVFILRFIGFDILGIPGFGG